MNKKIQAITLTVLFVFSILLPRLVSGYVLTVLAMAITYAVIADGYNILLGYAGVFSFGHMAISGLSGYVCLLILNNTQIPFLIAIVISVATVTAIATIFAYLAIGLSGRFFGISTLAIGESIVLILTNLDSITGGTQGLLLLKTPSLFGWEIISSTDHYYMSLLFFIIIVTITWFLINRTVLGKTWIAVRGNVELAGALGIDTKKARLTGYSVGTAIGALGGCLYMVIMMLLTPEQFGSGRTTEIVMMVLIGGIGTLFGPLLGALLLTWLPQVLNMSPQIRMIVYGLVLVVVILGTPSGIIGTVKQRLLKVKKVA